MPRPRVAQLGRKLMAQFGRKLMAQFGRKRLAQSPVRTGGASSSENAHVVPAVEPIGSAHLRGESHRVPQGTIVDQEPTSDSDASAD
mgnify:CR=1 FL=1